MCDNLMKQRRSRFEVLTEQIGFQVLFQEIDICSCFLISIKNALQLFQTHQIYQIIKMSYYGQLDIFSYLSNSAEDNQQIILKMLRNQQTILESQAITHQGIAYFQQAIYIFSQTNRSKVVQHLRQLSLHITFSNKKTQIIELKDFKFQDKLIQVQQKVGRGVLTMYIGNDKSLFEIHHSKKQKTEDKDDINFMKKRLATVCQQNNAVQKINSQLQILIRNKQPILGITTQLETKVVKIINWKKFIFMIIIAICSGWYLGDRTGNFIIQHTNPPTIQQPEIIQKPIKSKGKKKQVKKQLKKEQQKGKKKGEQKAIKKNRQKKGKM